MINTNKTNKIHLLQIKNLTVHIGNNILLDNLNFELKSGEIFALMGQSGAGKSTFLHTLLGNHKYTGEILWEGKPWDIDQLPWRIGFQPQHSGLLSDHTVGENIAMPLRYVANLPENIAMELAMARMLLFNLDANVFWKYPNELSGGMKRRVALARALVLDPPLLILDEPIAGLDGENVENFYKLLDSLTNTAVLCVTHNKMKAHFYGVLDKGKIHAGNKTEILEHSNSAIRNVMRGVY